VVAAAGAAYGLRGGLVAAALAPVVNVLLIGLAGVQVPGVPSVPHVLIGIVILAVVAARALRGRLSAEGVELAGLYWHFVDLVWVFIFTLFYLI